MVRLFVAVDIPSDLRYMLHIMGRGLPGSRPVTQDQIHLTLRFIGEVAGDMAKDIQDALLDISGRPFSLTLQDVGHFPPRGAPRVLWVGLAQSDDLQQLRNRIERRLINCGLPAEQRKFTPHITIARLKDTPLKRLGEFLAGNSLFRSAPFPVEHFSLYASTLTKNGAVHSPLARYSLSSVDDG